METMIASAILNGAICCVLLTSTNAFKMGFNQADRNTHLITYNALLNGHQIPEMPDGYIVSEERTPFEDAPLATLTVKVSDTQGHHKFTLKRIVQHED